MARARTATEQVQDTHKQVHIVSPVPPGFPGSKTADSMVVSTAAEVNALLQRIPEGRLATLDGLRHFLARHYGADMACPVSTAIFMNVTARAAEEQASQGSASITPYWRALRPGGALNPKYPGGEKAHRARLEAEGFQVIRQRKGYVVADYEAFLYAWEDM